MQEYMSYDGIEPFGDVRANWHAAIIAHIIAVAHSNPKRKPPDLKDFMWRTPKRRVHDNVISADEFFAARVKRD